MHKSDLSVHSPFESDPYWEGNLSGTPPEALLLTEAQLELLVELEAAELDNKVAAA